MNALTDVGTSVFLLMINAYHIRMGVGEVSRRARGCRQTVDLAEWAEVFLA